MFGEFSILKCSSLPKIRFKEKHNSITNNNNKIFIKIKTDIYDKVKWSDVQQWSDGRVAKYKEINTPPSS